MKEKMITAGKTATKTISTPFNESEKNRLFNIAAKYQGKRYSSFSFFDDNKGTLKISVPSEVRAKEESFIAWLLAAYINYKKTLPLSLQVNQKMPISIEFVNHTEFDFKGRDDFDKLFRREMKQRDSFFLKSVGWINHYIMLVHNQMAAAVKANVA